MYNRIEIQAFLFMKRRTIFKLNKDLDKEMINVFSGHKQGGVDFSGCIFGVHPELKKVSNMVDKKERKKSTSL